MRPRAGIVPDSWEGTVGIGPSMSIILCLNDGYVISNYKICVQLSYYTCCLDCISHLSNDILVKKFKFWQITAFSRKVMRLYVCVFVYKFRDQGEQGTIYNLKIRDIQKERKSFSFHS